MSNLSPNGHADLAARVAARKDGQTRYYVTINYKIENPASPLNGQVRSTVRSYVSTSGPAAVTTARANFLGSRSAAVRIVATDVKDEHGNYAF